MLFGYRLEEKNFKKCSCASFPFPISFSFLLDENGIRDVIASTFFL